MRLRSFTTDNLNAKTRKRGVFSLFLLSLFGFLSLAVYPQKVAVLIPETTDNAAKISEILSRKLNALDADLTASVLRASDYGSLYNLSTDEAKNLGRALGSDFFIVLKAENLRRTSFSKPLYYESYAAVYLVSARTGRLVFWTLESVEGVSPKEADEKFFASLETLGDKLKEKINFFYPKELAEKEPPRLEELPDENSPEAKDFTSPLPYKRQVPAYKPLANLYGVTATVDATVDLNEKGEIVGIEITRWAGYDLDESVVETIRKMNWRPASRGGKTLPIRVLLRYNFKKIEKEEEP